MAESFGVMERHSVDLKVIQALCASGIPFNVLINPEFQDMGKQSTMLLRTTSFHHSIKLGQRFWTSVKEMWRRI